MANPDPVNIPNGGPLGTGDRYLQVSSDGVTTPRAVTYNITQWIGNYVAAGVAAVEMDVANFGATSVSMRFALRQIRGQNFVPGYVSTTALVLPPDGVWRHMVVPLDASHLTAVNSPPSLSTFLTNVGEARILNATSASFVGDSGTFTFGVDNIHAFAFAVPEPATWGLIGISGVGVVAAVMWYRRRHKHALDRAYDEDEFFEE
jgi:hypothetical protein